MSYSRRKRRSDPFAAARIRPAPFNNWRWPQSMSNRSVIAAIPEGLVGGVAAAADVVQSSLIAPTQIMTAPTQMEPSYSQMDVERHILDSLVGYKRDMETMSQPIRDNEFKVTVWGEDEIDDADI